MPTTNHSRRAFVRAAMRAPYLTAEEERALAVAWRETGDKPALDRLAGAHMRLVVALAARFRRFGLSMSDLIQEGHVGLMEAAARFDPDREVRFSTYAAWWIRARIQDFVLRNWSIVRGGTSSAQKTLFFGLRKALARAAGRDTGWETGASARRQSEEIARTLGVPVGEVDLLRHRLSGPDRSLNAPVREGEEDGGRRQDFLICDAPLPDELAGEAIDGSRRLAWLRAALEELSERELEIMRARRLSDEPKTLDALGAKLGISKERVRQIEKRALEKLRKVLLRKHPDLAART